MITRKAKFDDEEDESDVSFPKIYLPYGGLHASRYWTRGMPPRIQKSSAKRLKRLLRLKPKQMQKRQRTRNPNLSG